MRKKLTRLRPLKRVRPRGPRLRQPVLPFNDERAADPFVRIRPLVVRNRDGVLYGNPHNDRGRDD